MFEKDVLTTGEVARLLKVTTNTVVKWFETGLLKGYTFPGTKTRRILRDSFEKFCVQRKIPLKRIQVERFLTTGQCAEICNVTVNTITKWVDKELLPGFTIESERRLIFLRDLKRFMKQNGMPVERLGKYEKKKTPKPPAKKGATKRKDKKKKPGKKKKARARKKKRGRKPKKK
jgi:excisionase family DNA binding protein